MISVVDHLDVPKNYYKKLIEVKLGIKTPTPIKDHSLIYGKIHSSDNLLIIN